MMMQIFHITQGAIDLITEFEGFSHTIYMCPALKPTVGFGHVVRYNDYFDIFKGSFIKRTSLLLHKKCQGRKETNSLLGKIFPKLITRQNAITLLKHDLGFAVKILQKNVIIELNTRQIGALLSFIYNIGGHAFEKSTLLRKLNQSDILGAADEFERWIYAGKKPLKGLMVRRKKEKEFFLSVKSTNVKT